AARARAGPPCRPRRTSAAAASRRTSSRAGWSAPAPAGRRRPPPRPGCTRPAHAPGSRLPGPRQPDLAGEPGDVDVPAGAFAQQPDAPTSGGAVGEEQHRADALGSLHLACADEADLELG